MNVVLIYWKEYTLFIQLKALLRSLDYWSTYSSIEVPGLLVELNFSPILLSYLKLDDRKVGLSVRRPNYAFIIRNLINLI